MALEKNGGSDFPDRERRNNDRADRSEPRAEPENEKNELGLNEDDEPSPGAYESESAAPLTSADRDEVEERIASQTDGDVGNEANDLAGNEVENGPGVDPSDPNLSAAITEAGVEERQNEMGLPDIEEFLDDPEDGEKSEGGEAARHE